MGGHEAADNAGMVESMLACTSLEEFSSLLEERGIWLNEAAVQTAFSEVARIKSGKLNDDELAAVGGGVRFYEPYDTMSAIEAAIFGQMG